MDELLVYVQTSKAEADYGDFVLFTLVADQKLDPHNGAGPEWTNKNIWTGRAEYVQVIDENVPLIVFDTTTKTVDGVLTFCPEENTFPDPLIAIGGTDEKYFHIVGYTLRENESGLNEVKKIPHGVDSL